ncbi:MAG: Hsp20/alpha crystallin family protein, partial [Cyanobacteria bacterium Co-bin8]|nr:Hsp20/alpha crystallin family protein [Cyanobacteria bacterium Co-bin8]
MTLIRWEPLREIETLQKEMNRLFDQLSSSELSQVGSGAFFPAAEMNETEEAIDLRVEIPGVAREDIDVQVSVASVAISGKRRTETKTEQDGMTRSEFHYGKFERLIPLPSRIQNTHVDAQYKDGILTLHLPKV